METKVEQWRPVDGFGEFYEVSSLGRIRRLKRRTVDGRTLAPRMLCPVLRSGYHYVTLCGHNHRCNKAIHRLVCAAFSPIADSSLRDVNHRNGRKLDNVASNLEWCDRSYNLRHAADIGLKAHGEQSHLAKLRLAQVREIRALLAAGGMSQEAIGRRFGVTQTQVSRIKLGKKWRND